MDDDARDMARRFDNLETDPQKLELFRLLYSIEDRVRELPEGRVTLAIDSAIIQALEVVRMLPSARHS